MAHVRDLLAKLQWKEEGPWRWKHTEMEATLSAEEVLLTNLDKQRREDQHKIRESWRRREWHKWRVKPGRKQAQLQHLRYDEKWITRARKRYGQHDGTASR